MFSHSFMNFDDDPFFREHQRHMQEMDRMMGNFGGFAGFGRPFVSPFGMLEGPRDDRGNRTIARREDPFTSGFGSMFDNMNSMMSQMHRNFGNFENMASNPNGYSYSSSQVMSYSNDGRGAPKYFEASSSTKTAPGGVKETQKTVRDSEKGVHKMAVGHHIGDRAHVIEKSRNTRTEEEEQKQDFLNMDEGDAGKFDQEWKEKTRGFHAGRNGIGGLQDSHRRHGDQHRQRNTPALEYRSHRERDDRERYHAGRERRAERNHAGEERRRERKEKKVRVEEPANSRL